MVRTKEERKEENKKLMKFLSEKCETAEEPLNIANMVKEFIEKEGTSTPLTTLCHFVKTYKATEVFEIKDKETMVRQIFALGAKVNKPFLAKLREHATVKLDDAKRIKEYEANDGHLTLHGVHCNRKKQQETMNERRSSQMVADGAESEEEEEEDDGDLLDMAADPELQPPAPKRPRVEEPGNSSGNSSGNLPGPGIENVKEEVPENFDVKIENPEDTEALDPQMNEVKTEEPDSSFAPNPATPRQSRRDVPTPNPPPALPAAPESFPATQPPSKTSVANNSAAPVIEPQNLSSNPPAAPGSSSSSQPPAPTGSDFQNLSGGKTVPPPINAVTAEEPDSSVASNLVTPAAAPVFEAQNSPASLLEQTESSSATQTPVSTASGSAAPAQHPLLALPVPSGSFFTTQPLVPTGSDVNTATAPGQSSAPIERSHQNPPATHEVITLDDDEEEEEDVKPEIVNVNASTTPSAAPSTNSPPTEDPKKLTLPIATQTEILKQLEIIIGMMDIPMDSSKIRGQIQRIVSEEGGEKLEELEMEDVEKTMAFSIVAAKRKNRSEGGTRSLKQFLHLLHLIVVKQEFEQIEKDLKQQLEALKSKDTLVPVANITEALEAMVKILVSN